MKILRYVAGYTHMDKKRIEEIREELKVTRLYYQVKQRKLDWYQHVQRMSPERIPQQILRYHPKGRRDPGRPKTRWKDFVDGTG